MVRSIDPRREALRAIQWQSSKPPYCLELMSRNPSWQRSCATASTDRTYDRKRSDPRAAPPLAARGPSTYGLPGQVYGLGTWLTGVRGHGGHLALHGIGCKGGPFHAVARGVCHGSAA